MMIGDKLLDIVERFANRPSRLNVLADTILNQIVPQGTARAGNCWCETVYCRQRGQE
jgi:hypothetical protein